MKLYDLLKLEKFQYLNLINSNVNLDRNVITVESSETPDMCSYIPENAILITTAMHYIDKQSELCSLIEQLNEINCAGLAIKINRFLKDLDPSVIEKCNELAFPLFIIPAYKTLGDVYKDFSISLWETNHEDLTHALNSQKIISNLLLRKPSISSILKTLSRLLKVQVALVDPFGNLEPASKHIANTYSKSAIRNLVYHLRGLDGSAYYNEIVDITGKKCQVKISTLFVTSHYPHYLIIFNSERLMNTSYTFIIEQALFAIEFTVSRNLIYQYFNLEKKEKDFETLMDLCKEGDIKKILQHSHDCKIEYLESGRNIILNIINFDKIFPKHAQRESYTLIYNWLEGKISKLSNYILYPLRDKNLYFIQTSDQEIEHIIPTLLKYSDILKGILGIELQITIGPRFFSGIYQYHSFKETIYALNNEFNYKNYDNVKVSQTQSFINLASHIPKEELQFYCQSVLGNLYDSKYHNSDKYRKTLKIWLLNKCNISKTAQILYLHRNTVNYHIDTCKKILDSDLENPEELFNLGVALNLLDYIE